MPEMNNVTTRGPRRLPMYVARHHKTTTVFGSFNCYAAQLATPIPGSQFPRRINPQTHFLIHPTYRTDYLVGAPPSREMKRCSPAGSPRSNKRLALNQNLDRGEFSLARGEVQCCPPRVRVPRVHVRSRQGQHVGQPAGEREKRQSGRMKANGVQGWYGGRGCLGCVLA